MQICLCIFATSHVQHFEPVVIAIVIAIPIVVVGVTTIITVGVAVSVTVVSNACVQRTFCPLTWMSLYWRIMHLVVMPKFSVL